MNDIFDELFDDIEVKTMANKKNADTNIANSNISNDFDFEHTDFGDAEDGAKLPDDFGNAITDDVAQLNDYGEPIIIAYLDRDQLVFITNGNEGRLLPCLKALKQTFGSKIIKLPVGSNDVDELKSNGAEFNRVYADWVNEAIAERMADV